ncbi:hypothetical protein ACOSOMT5_P1018 [Acidiphilium sp. MT5]
MNISPQDAEQSLAAIATANQESQTRRGYRKAAPYIIGWGVTWAIGYTGTSALSPSQSNKLWLALILIMIGFSGVIMRWQSGHKLGWGRIALFTAVPSAALILLVNLIVNVFDIHSATTIAALFILIVAAAYAVTGLKYGRRYTQLGVALALLTALGLWLLPPPLKIIVLFFDAACLLLVGLWFRSA